MNMVFGARTAGVSSQPHSSLDYYDGVSYTLELPEPHGIPIWDYENAHNTGPQGAHGITDLKVLWKHKFFSAIVLQVISK